MDDLDQVDRTEASLKASQQKYYASPKGKAKKAKQNRKYKDKIDQTMITFAGNDREIYDFIIKNKADRSFNEIALVALREWIVRSL